MSIHLQGFEVVITERQTQRPDRQATSGGRSLYVIIVCYCFAFYGYELVLATTWMESNVKLLSIN